MSQDEKDARLGQEDQFPGRLLGDVVRGSQRRIIFNRIEHIRKLAVALRRIEGVDDIAVLKGQLDHELDGRSAPNANSCSVLLLTFREESWER